MISEIELKNFGKIGQLKIDNITNKNVYLTGPNGSGKSLDVMTPILTPFGWVRLKDIRIGDVVYDVDGRECKVTGVYPQPCKLEVYRVTFSDNCYIDCCEEHNWMYTPRGLHNTDQKWKVGTTKEMIKELNELKETRDGLAVPVCKAINYFQREELPIDPYVLGVLLSAGRLPKSKAISIIAKDPDIGEKIAECLLKIAVVKQDKNDKNVWWLVDDTSGLKHSLSYILKHIGLRGMTVKDRRIPQIYLRSSIKSRRKLLCGLMDGGGTIDPKHGIVFRTRAAGLFRDFVELVRSLGFRCVSFKKYRSDLHCNEYFISVITRSKIFSAKKFVEYDTKKPHKKPHHCGNYDVLMIKRIVKLKKFVEMRCLQVDSPTHTYITKNYIPTHNTTVLQAVSLALTGKAAKGLTIDKYIGPRGDDFSVILTLDDGTKIGRTSKKSKLRLPDGRVYNKTKDVYEQLPFDPALLFNISYVKQGEIADLFSSGGKAVIDKLVGMVINSKRLNDGYASITKTLNVNNNTIDTLSDQVSASLNQYNEDDVENIERQIEATKARLAKANCDISADEINRYINIHNSYKQAQANYEALKNNGVVVPDKPNITMEYAKDKNDKYRIYSRAADKKKEAVDKINSWENLRSDSKIVRLIKEFLGLDTRLLKNKYTVEELEEIGSRNRAFMEVLLTDAHYSSKEEANEEFIRYCRDKDIDSQNIINAKNTFEIVRVGLIDFESEVKELKAIGYTPDNFDSNVQNEIDKLKNEIAEYDITLSENYEQYPMTDDKYYSLRNEWVNYTNALKEKEYYDNKLEEARKNVEALAERLEVIPSMEEITEIKAAYSSKMEIQNSLMSLTRHLNTLKSIKNQIDEAQERINTLEKKNEKLAHWKGILADAPVRLRQGLFGPVVDCFNREFYSLFSFESLGEINIDWGKYQINVGNKTIEQCSGAQMVALGLCMRLALLQVMGSFIPLMLVDEPTVHLDDDRKNDVKKLLAAMSKYSQIIASTHDDEIVDGSARVIDMSTIE